MACSFLCFVAVLLASCLTMPAAGEQEQLLRRAAALSFGEGYTQLFGDSNLALHGGGKRVHITLDERTGLGSLLARPMPSCSLEWVGLIVALFHWFQAPGSRLGTRTSTASSAPASSCPPTTPPESSSRST
jgi:hypothetical protein